MASGVFGLRKVYKKQVENVDNNNFASWPEDSIYGYYGGGFAPGLTPANTALIDRIDFSSETTSVPGNNLPAGRYGLAATSSSSYGYFGGGAPPFLATIDRIDFSSETTSAPGHNLPQARAGLSAVSNDSYGYFGGGYTPTIVATVDRIDFSNETFSVPGNDLSEARFYIGGTSSDSYGYYGGGRLPTESNRIDRIDFSSETTSVPGNNLTQKRYGAAGTSSGSYGYFGGGGVPTTPATVATVDRIDFFNETTSAPGNNLPQARQQLASTSNSLYGYFGGGFTAPGVGGRVTTVDRIDFFNETLSVPSNSLSEGRNALAAVSGGASVARANGYGTYGYTIGGWGPPAICNITRQDFSTNTFSDVGTLSTSLYGNDRSAYNNEYGYFGGGYSPSPPPAAKRSALYRFDFMNESVRTLTNSLPQIADRISQTSTTQAGYFGGGYSYRFSPPVPATFHSKICKLDFSSESVSTLPASGRLSAQKGNATTVRSPQYAFFAGGFNQTAPAIYSSVDRLDFSTDVTSSYGNMTRIRYKGTSIENNTYGYFWGGFGPTANPNFDHSDFEKLQFSNGTFTNFPNSISPLKTYIQQSSQTDSYNGYFIGGGFQPVPFGGSPAETLVRRLDFSSDTVAILPPNIPRTAQMTFSMSNGY